ANPIGGIAMSRRILALLLAFATLALPPSARAADPPGPVTPIQFRTHGHPVAGPFDVVLVVQDFAPGAWNPWHTHAGEVVITVLDGAMVRRGDDGSEATYKAGESWVELPDMIHQAGNTGTAPPRLMAAFVLPQGAPLSTPVPGRPVPAPGPTTPFQFRTA